MRILYSTVIRIRRLGGPSTNGAWPLPWVACRLRFAFQLLLGWWWRNPKKWNRRVDQVHALHNLSMKIWKVRPSNVALRQQDWSFKWLSRQIWNLPCWWTNTKKSFVCGGRKPRPSDWRSIDRLRWDSLSKANRGQEAIFSERNEQEVNFQPVKFEMVRIWWWLFLDVNLTNADGNTGVMGTNKSIDTN